MRIIDVVPGDLVVDGFLGSGTTGEVCLRNNIDFYGIELDPDVFNLAKERLENVKKELER